MSATMTQQDTIYADLQEALTQGDWKPGTSLPSLRKLADRYSTSVGTVRGALTRLQYEGRVVAQHGSGYYVSEDRATRMKTVLLLARTEGDLWTDFMQNFTEQLACDSGIRLIIEPSPRRDAISALERKIEHYLTEGLEAIIFDSTHGSPLRFLEAYAGRTRLICFGHASFTETWSCGKVISDDFHGGYVGTRHLLDQGARDILLLFPHTYEDPSCQNQRDLYAGAVQAVEDSPAQASIHRLILEANQAAFAPNVLSEIATHPQTDAIFSFCDFRFETVLPALQSAGKRIPQDIRLMGYYDTPWCQHFVPNLSSINLQPARIVQDVIDMLHDGHDRTVMVRPKLVARDSSLTL